MRGGLRLRLDIIRAPASAQAQRQKRGAIPDGRNRSRARQGKRVECESGGGGTRVHHAAVRQWLDTGKDEAGAPGGG